jgi:hypothetical protein
MSIPTLTDAAARTLAKATAKASTYDREEPAIERAGDRAGGFALLWSLQARGLLALGKYPELWDGLAEQVDAASADAVVGLLRSVGEAAEEEENDDDSDDDDSDDDDDDSDDDSDDDDSDDDDPFAELERRYHLGEDDGGFDPWTGFWSEDLDRIVLTAFLRDPAAFDGLEATLRPDVARGLSSVRLRAGQELSDAAGDAVVAGYARMVVHGDGGPSEMLVIDRGEVVDAPFFDEAQGRLGPHVQALVERVGGEPAWRRHVLAAALSASNGSMELRYAHEAFVEADDALVPYLLSRVNWGNRDNLDRAYACLLARRVPPDRLLGFADALGDARFGVAADVCRTCAVLRFGAEGEPVPASVDERLTLRAVMLGYPPHRADFVGLARLAEALHALGPARAAAVLRRRLDASLADAVRALPALSAVPDPALVEHALSVVAQDLPAAIAAADDDDVPIQAWRLLGDTGLEGLAARLAALPEAAPAPAPAKGGKAKGGRAKAPRAPKGGGTKARAALHRALLAALVAKVERDEGTLEPRWDRWLGVDALPGKDEPWAEALGPSIRHVLRRLRPAERDRVLDDVLARGGPELPRVFAFVDFGTPGLRARALDRFAAEPVVRCDRPWMESAANRLGVAFHEEVRQLLRRHPDAEARLSEALGRPLLDSIVGGPRSEAADALRKALAKPGLEGPRVTIHVMQPWDDVRADVSVISRAGPTAIGVTAERWPRDLDGEPMRHMLTLRLADVPELAARFPGKAALAVFLAHDGGHAYDPDSDDAAVLLLDDDDLARGELDLTRGDEDDDDDDDDDDDLDPYISADTRPFTLTPLDVPLAAFGPDEGASKALRKLHEQLDALPGRVGGPPGWMRGEGHDGRFVLQVDDDFESLPVPGRARLYVFEDAALWQTRET